MEKQQKILEMAKDICRVKLNCNDVCNPISACDALKYAERAVEAGYCKQSEWISVEEALPEKDDIYLVCLNGLPADFDRFVVIDGEGYFEHSKVTHWLPIPEAPKMKGGE